MALTLDATVGGASANAYVNRTDAQAYFDGRPFSDDWTNASATQKDQALVFATSLLERESWLGSKGSTHANAASQSLAWPRQWAPTLEFSAPPIYIAEYFIDTTVVFYSSVTIPRPIVRATCELALEVLRSGAADPSVADRSLEWKSKKVGELNTTYADRSDRAIGLGRYPNVYNLIAPLLRGMAATEIERA